jgi:hypothetical protein
MLNINVKTAETQLEQGSPGRQTTGHSHLRYRPSGVNNGDAIDFRRALRQSSARPRHRTSNSAMNSRRFNLIASSELRRRDQNIRSQCSTHAVPGADAASQQGVCPRREMLLVTEAYEWLADRAERTAGRKGTREST